MNIDEREKFGRDEPNFQDEYLDDDRNAALDDGVIDDEDQNLNRQFNDIDNNRNDEDDVDAIDKESRNDEEDYDDIDDDDDLEETDQSGDLYKDVDLSLQDEINQDREEIDPVNHQRKF